MLADGNGLYGLWPFAREAARLGLHGVFGCEIVHGERRLVALAEDGSSAIPLLGGHRGANDLARLLGAALGGHAALSTAEGATG